MMDDDRCEGKQKHTFEIAKKISKSSRKRGKPPMLYKCRLCGHWHVAHPLTGSLRHVKYLKRV